MAGIVGYGAYIPKYRISCEEIAKNYNKSYISIINGLAVKSKSFAGLDEDSVTMAYESSVNALKMAQIDKTKIGAIFSGSESKVYAVKPNASIIGEALGIGNNFTAADIEFACKAGTVAMQCCIGLVDSGIIEYGVAIGSDTAQSNPGNIIEYTSSSGSASFIIGNKKEEIIAEIEGTASYTSDSPDFWRRNMQRYPQHAERFTGDPSYFKHIVEASKLLMDKLGLKTNDFDLLAFHTPNGKFPLKAARLLGFSKETLKHSLIVSELGNTYSGATLLALCNVLDKCKGNERILVVSFGSGAGSDAFSLKISDLINNKKRLVKRVDDYMKDAVFVDYQTYLRYSEAQ